MAAAADAAAAAVEAAELAGDADWGPTPSRLRKEAPGVGGARSPEPDAASFASLRVVCSARLNRLDDGPDIFSFVVVSLLVNLPISFLRRGSFSLRRYSRREIA